MCQQRVSKAASVCGDAEKKGGERRSRASIARRSRTRSHARKPPVSGRTLHGDERGAERRERQQRLAARHTREHHRAPAREKSTARRGCVRRAAVPFPVIRDARSTVESLPFETLESLGLRSGRAGLRAWARSCGGGAPDADPMLARRNTRDFFRLPDSPQSAVAIGLFFMVHEPCARSASPRGGAQTASRFRREGAFPRHRRPRGGEPAGSRDFRAFRAASRARSVCATPTHR